MIIDKKEQLVKIIMPPSNTNINMLSIDDGGTGIIIPVAILKNLKDRTRKEPYDLLSMVWKYDSKLWDKTRACAGIDEILTLWSVILYFMRIVLIGQLIIMF